MVLKAVDGTGWLVWLLAPSPAAGTIPVGGHYRVSVSADGGTVLRGEALSVGCLVMDPKRDTPPGGTSVMLTTSQVVASAPLETYVFLNLLYRMPMMVVAGDRIWSVDRGRIADQGPAPKPASSGARSAP